MATLHVRTGQDQNAILLHSANNQDNDPSNMSYTGSTKVPFKSSRVSISSSHTLSTCSSWTSVSPSSLALQPTFSADYSTEDAASLANEKLEINDSTTNNCQHCVALYSGVAALPLFLETPSDLTTKQKEWNEEAANNNEQKVNFVGARDRCCDSGLASERRHWIEQTLLNNDYKPYSTNAREEISKYQGNSKLTSERKKWIESTLLSPVRSSYSQKNDVKQGLQELQQVSSSVAERRKWLAGMTQVKSAAELEEEVRQERATAKNVAAMREIEEHTCSDNELMNLESESMVTDEHVTCAQQAPDGWLATHDKEKQLSSESEQGGILKKDEKMCQIWSSDVDKDDIVKAGKEHMTLKCPSVKSPDINKKCSFDKKIGALNRKKKKPILKGLFKRFALKG